MLSRCPVNATAVGNVISTGVNDAHQFFIQRHIIRQTGHPGSDLPQQIKINSRLTTSIITISLFNSGPASCKPISFIW